MTGPDWLDPPARPHVSSDAVDVWRAAITGRPEARIVLRCLLAGYLGLGDPAEVSFEIGPHGKPALSGRELSFNMSHTRGLALFAFAVGTEVGVDVEHSGRTLKALRAGARFIGRDEAERLSGLAPEAQRSALLRVWVRHEAIVKCQGTGIAGTAAGAAAGAAAKPGAPAAPVPWVTDLDPGDGAAAAVAVAAGPRPLRLWQWRGAGVAGP